MKPPEIVDRDHVRFSVFYAIKKVLRAWLGKGDHDPLARKAADGVMEHFELSKWSVQGSPLEPHSTPGPRRDPGSAD
jgi:hypothetical protein